MLAWLGMAYEMNSRTHKTALAKDGGFALVSVIWIATLLAVVAFIFTASVRARIRSASTDLAVAEAEILADAGVNLAILDMTSAARFGRPRRFPADGSLSACGFPSGGAIMIRVRDEAGKLDLNIANDEALVALFAGLGASREEATARAQAIADYRDPDDERRPSGAERDEYVSAQRPLLPKNAPFESIDELAQVIGFDGEQVRRLRPFVTIHAEQQGIDPAKASAELIAILSRGAREVLTDGLAQQFNASDGLPASLKAVSAGRAYSIEAEVLTRRGARFVREAVVSLAASLPTGARDPLASRSTAPPRGQTYRIWSWRHGERFTDDGTTASLVSGGLPAC